MYGATVGRGESPWQHNQTTRGFAALVGDLFNVPMATASLGNNVLSRPVIQGDNAVIAAAIQVSSYSQPG